MVFCNFFYFLCMKLSWSCDPGRRFNWVEQVDLGCFSFIFLFNTKLEIERCNFFLFVFHGLSRCHDSCCRFNKLTRNDLGCFVCPFIYFFYPLTLS
jgi:hypothetical protein